MPPEAETPDEGSAGSEVSGDGGHSAPSDAFGVLGNPLRLDVLRSLGDEQPRPFADLYADSDADTSAGFAYHLRQLRGRFVRQRDDEQYELTGAGRRAARSVRSGAYGDVPSIDPIVLEDPCPHCADTGLVVTADDDVMAVSCRTCERPVLRLSIPPGSVESRESAGLPEAVDGYHRRRIASFGDGVCPDCGGDAVTRIREAESAEGRRDSTDRTAVAVRATCPDCGTELSCPVVLAVRDHPSVVAFYEEHGEDDVRERPVWNVGNEWSERIIATDPWCVRVSACLDRIELVLYVGGDASVAEHRRVDPDDEEPAGWTIGSEETAEQADGTMERSEPVENPGKTLEPGDEATA